MNLHLDSTKTGHDVPYSCNISEAITHKTSRTNGQNTIVFVSTANVSHATISDIQQYKNENFSFDINKKTATHDIFKPTVSKVK